MFQRAKSCCAKKVLPWMKYLGGIMRGQMPYLGERWSASIIIFLNHLHAKEKYLRLPLYISRQSPSHYQDTQWPKCNKCSANLFLNTKSSVHIWKSKLNIEKYQKSLVYYNYLSNVTWILNRIISLIAVLDDSLYLIKKNDMN